MRRILASLILLLLIKVSSNAQSYISGYLMITDQEQRFAEGVEIRLMCGQPGFTTSGSDAAIPLHLSRFTQGQGYFWFQGTDLDVALRDCKPPFKIYFNVRLDGYADSFTPIKAGSGNLIEIKRGASDLFDLTERRPPPMTDTDRLRAEMVRAYNELAVREYELGLRDMLAHKTDSAVGHFKNATQAAPAFYEAWMNLGSMQRDSKHPSDAAKAFEKAALARPGAAEPLTELGSISLDEGHYKEAATSLKAATVRAPWSSDAYYYLGSALFKLNQYPEAEDALKTALEKINPRADARLMLVNVYLKQSRYPEALDQLDRYLDAVPDSPQKDAARKTQATIREALLRRPLAPVAPKAADKPSKPDAALLPIVDRAVAYVAKYENELGSLLGSEEYVQDASWTSVQSSPLTTSLSRGGPINGNVDQTLKRIERRTNSDFLLIQIGSQWVPLREVNVVDGKKIANNPEAFPFDDSPANNTRRFNAMKADSTKYNIGDVVRELNLPTFALQVLRKSNVSRFSFEHNGNEKIGEITAWRVRFKETSGPTLVSAAGGKDLFSNGTLWIDPETGAVLKTEMNLNNSVQSPEIQSKVTVTYGPSKSVNVSVPLTMEEHYAYGNNIIDCRANYTNFRPFTVSVQFEPTVTPKP